MTKEEEKAIERLTNGKKIDFNTLIRKFKKEGIENFVITKKEYIETVLNMLKNLQKKNKTLTQTNRSYKGMIKKKDKQIDIMAKTIRKLAISLASYEGSYDKETINFTGNIRDIKQYFERKAKE